MPKPIVTPTAVRVLSEARVTVKHFLAVHAQ